jgi:predicted alpha/beta-fold hydrolase
MRAFRAPCLAAGRQPADHLAGKLCARRRPGRPPRWRRERWATPDGDFIDVDFAAPGGAPLLVLFHGLEGSSASHYAQAFAVLGAARGWAGVPHFRGCSGELNLAPRAYHSGDFEEIGWMLGGCGCEPGPAAGGGHLAGRQCAAALGREAGEAPRRWPRGGRGVSPLDLAAAAAAIGRGFNRQVYTRMFLRTMKPKALAKWQQHPGLFDRERLPRATCTSSTTSSPRRCTALPRHRRLLGARLGQAAPARIRIPALVLNARNDPFVPAASLPAAGGPAAGHAVAAGAGRARGLSGRALSGPCAGLPQAVATGWPSGTLNPPPGR